MPVQGSRAHAGPLGDDVERGLPRLGERLARHPQDVLAVLDRIRAQRPGRGRRMRHGTSRKPTADPLRYIKLGTSGLAVSPVAIGAMTYGEPDRGHPVWSLGEADSRPLIRHAIEAGINFFD